MRSSVIGLIVIFAVIVAGGTGIFSKANGSGIFSAAPVEHLVPAEIDVPRQVCIQSHAGQPWDSTSEVPEATTGAQG